MKKFAIVALILTLGIIGFAVPPVVANATNDKVTICHAAGLAGTTHFVTLTISSNAVYGPGGHFNENGTTQAGHEQDYLGACEGDETTTTTDTTTTTETETTPTSPNPPCVPRNPDGSLGGKDGKPGNDDCAADETIPTPTIPEETTPTTPEPPVTTTPEQPPVTVTPPVVVTPPAVNDTLEKELDKQAKKNAKNNPSPNSRPTASGELPRTGLPLGLAVALGLSLIGGGLGLRRKS